MAFYEFDEGMENYGKKMESDLDVLLQKPLTSESKSPELVENGIWSRLFVGLMREWKTMEIKWNLASTFCALASEWKAVELVENGFED